MAMDHVAIVGASLAGLRAAQALRRLGFGGRITAIGAERHLPYDRPPLSKQILAGKWDAERAAIYRPEEDDALEVDWRLGARAVRLEPAARRIVLEDGREVSFDGLVIATGASARTLPGTEHLGGVHVLRTLDDCLALRAVLDRSPKVAIVGAGFIGLEVAATCRGRGLDTTVIEALPTPLERVLEPAMGALVAQVHRDQGVDLRTGQGVARFLGEDQVAGLVLADGSRIDADVIVVGIGARPATSWLENSGLALDDGVVCDERCFAAPGIVAAGDVARWHNPLFDESMRVEQWTNATEQADAAIANLLAGDQAGEPFASVPFFWSDQYDRRIQAAGRARPDDESALVDGSERERRFVRIYGRAGRLVGVLGFNRARLVMKYRQLIREGASFQAACEA